MPSTETVEDQKLKIAGRHLGKGLVRDYLQDIRLIKLLKALQLQGVLRGTSRMFFS